MTTKREHRMALLPVILALGVASSMVATGMGRADAATAMTRNAAAPQHSTTNQALTASKPAAGQAVRLVIVPSASVAHYRVREQLTFFSLPTDAVGTTNAVSGAIVLDAHGRPVAAQSKIVVDLRTLKTDQSRRDQYVQSNVLETASYPLAVFVVKQAPGLPAHLPTTGKITFSLVGALTVHGVTRSETWTVSATLSRQSITGTASTHFAMTDFNITPPQIGPVLSVQNNVKLDITVQMTRSTVSHT